MNGLVFSSTSAAFGLTIRPEAEADQPFLLRLYQSVRRNELAPTGWSDERKAAFLASQFALQRRHFAINCAGADFSILDHSAGPIGRLVIDRRQPERLHVIDLAFCPEWRGCGIGGALLRAVIAEAGGRPVTLNVECANPARRLYGRLGFVEIEPQGTRILMRA